MDQNYIQAFEQKRKTAYEAYKKDLILGLLLLVVLVGFYYLYKAMKIKEEFNRSFKKEFVLSLVNQTFEDASYDPKGGLSQHQINQMGMVRKPDRFHSEDLITGKYKNVRFQVSDIKMEERVQTRDSKGNVRYHYQTYFKGRWLIYKFSKNFNQTIKIQEGRFLNTMNTRGLEKIEVESIAFSKKFMMYTSDRQHVFYVLTPQIIERLMQLEQMHKGTIMYVFKDDELHVGINDNTDYLEVKFSKPITDAVAETFKSQVSIIAAIINELKLDSNKFQ